MNEDARMRLNQVFADHTSLIMKATTLSISVILLLFASAAPARAQHDMRRMQSAPADTSERASSRTGMPLVLASGTAPAIDPVEGLQVLAIEEAMQDPLRRSVVLLYGLRAFGEPLNLSDVQIADLGEEHAKYLVRIQSLGQRAERAAGNLNNELAKPTPEPSRVRALLRERAIQESDVTALAFEVAAGMLEVLTPVQRQVLADLAPAVLHHQMATHLMPAEMMKAMSEMDAMAHADLIKGAQSR